MLSDSRVSLQDVSFTYEEAPSPALSEISAAIRPGEFIAVLGHNGSGKSTLAKLVNALYIPSKAMWWSVATIPAMKNLSGKSAAVQE